MKRMVCLSALLVCLLSLSLLSGQVYGQLYGQAPPPSPQTKVAMMRGLLCLKYLKWDQAIKSFHQVLTLDPAYAPAHIGRLCAELKVTEEKRLIGVVTADIGSHPSFRAALACADPAYKAQIQKYAAPIDVRMKAMADGIKKDGETHEAGERIVLKINDVEYAFRWCPAGVFVMGRPKEESGGISNANQHMVMLSRGYWLQETEVTQEMWLSVMGNNPSKFTGMELPVHRVSWDDCMKYIRKLNGLKIAPKGYRFALPTEAQWEYACRAGTTTTYHFGDTLYQDMAYFDNDWSFPGRTKNVGSYPANAWGLHDMHGNICELCWDKYANYLNGAGIDPVEPAGHYGCVVRGDGGSAHRFGAGHPDECLGCRLALVSESPGIEGYYEYTGSAKTQTNMVTDRVKNDYAEEDTGKKAGDRTTLTINGMEYAFRWCPAGNFLMGSPQYEADRDNDETQHRVVLSRGFYMLETEVTQAMWENVMNDNPSHFAGTEFPVEGVSWNDCQKYIKQLNDLGVAPKGYRFSLPTEAQWEYACRAGKKTPFYFGNALKKDEANFGGRDAMWVVGQTKGSLGSYPGTIKGSYGSQWPAFEVYKWRTKDVGSYPTNAWGLHDMHGNVFEWCLDCYGKYPIGAVTDPAGHSAGSRRVLRGGSWFHNVRCCRSADRENCDPSYRGDNFGCRLALVCESPDNKEHAGDADSAKAKANTVTGSENNESAGMDADKKAGDRTVLKIKEIEYAFRWCPAGTFTMGSPKYEEHRDNNETQHRVTLSRGFYMLETEVTQAMWENVMKNNPSRYKRMKRPVENVSWHDCQEYIAKLNRLDVAPKGYHFSLPTEAQWEYACRAGTTTPFCFGNDLAIDQANFVGVNYGMTKDVGSYAANAWGLQDMHGNVFEWCLDWSWDYPEDAVTDPAGLSDGWNHVRWGVNRCLDAVEWMVFCDPLQSVWGRFHESSTRITRGGSWGQGSKPCRSAYRGDVDPSWKGMDRGFRLALVSNEK